MNRASAVPARHADSEGEPTRLPGGGEIWAEF